MLNSEGAELAGQFGNQLGVGVGVRKGCGRPWTRLRHGQPAGRLDVRSLEGGLHPLLLRGEIAERGVTVPVPCIRLPVGLVVQIPTGPVSRIVFQWLG